MDIKLEFLLNTDYCHNVNESLRLFSSSGIWNYTFPLPHADHNMDYISKIEQWYQFSHDILLDIELYLYDDCEDELLIDNMQV